MALQQKITDALNESRILVLGAQIIIGFQWRAIFEAGYARLPWISQCLGIVALMLTLILLGLLVAPVCYHGIVCEGENADSIHRFTTKTTEAALIPFSFAVGIDLFLASGTLLSSKSAIIAGIAGFIVAIFFWFGLEAIYLLKPHPPKDVMQKHEPTPLWVKIDHVLTEARMVLPGAQALLGFQFLVFFTDSFQTLPDVSKKLHLSSLLLVCFSIVLLMTPAAFHRLVEHGEDTERFYSIANRLILGAMAPIALATAIDFYIVAAKVTRNDLFSILASSALLIYFLGFWFGYTLYMRGRRG